MCPPCTAQPRLAPDLTPPLLLLPTQFIETGLDGSGTWQPPLASACGVCFEVSCVPGQFVESAEGDIFLDRRRVCA